MAEKIVTFREMEHKAYLKDVFTVLFVVACGMPLAQGLFGLPVTGWFENIEEMTPALCALKTFLGLLYRGIGTLLPFLLFQMIKYRTPGRYFVKSAEKPSAVSVLSTAFASVGLGGGIYMLMSILEKTMTETGYVFSEPWSPSLAENDSITRVVFVVCAAVLPTLFYEIGFRGIVMNAVSDEHTGYAVVISAMLCAGSFVSFSVTPSLLISALVCGYGYAKTRSRFVSAFASALTGATVGVLYLFKDTCSVVFAVAFLAVGLAAAVVQIKTLSAKKAENNLSARDGARAFFGSFAMWIFVLMIVFVFLVFYIAKPKPQEETPVSSDGVEVSDGIEAEEKP